MKKHDIVVTITIMILSWICESFPPAWHLSVFWHLGSIGEVSSSLDGEEKHWADVGHFMELLCWLWGQLRMKGRMLGMKVPKNACPQ